MSTITIPTTEPGTLVAGDTWHWRRSFVDYRPADGWVLSYGFTAPDALYRAVTAADNGDGSHLVTLLPAVTTEWKATEYMWRAFVTKAPDRFSVGQGTVLVLEDLAVEQSHDHRSFAERMVEALQAAILGQADQTQLSYTVGEVSVARMSHDQLNDALSYWQKRAVVRKEQRRIRQGKPSGRVLYSRLFGR